MPTGVSRPPPTPCSTRKTTSAVRLPASPHRAEAAVNTPSAARNTGRLPNLSASQPDAGMETARLTR